MGMKPFLAAGACALLAACGASAEPGVFDLPKQEVYDRLSRNNLDVLRLRHSCGILIHLSQSARNGEEIDWRVTHNGETKLQFSVRLEEVSPTQTRVKLSIDSKDPEGGELYDGDYVTHYPAVQQPVRPGIEEAIAAVLEGREFDKSRARPGPDDDVCDVQRASFRNDGVPIDVAMERRNGSGSGSGSGSSSWDDEASDDWGSGTTD
jgi:hypothetical protein